MLAGPVDANARNIFNAAARVIIGNGNRTYFWLDKWINGKTVEDLAPGIYAIINPETKAKRTVAQALTQGACMEDIKKPITINLFMQILTIWEECNLVQLIPHEEDKWTWSWEAKGCFSTKSVYEAHYTTKIACALAPAIWGSWAPLRCKVATWLFLRGRVWTADRLARRGLPHNDKCTFCNTAEEDVQHLFIGCAISNIIWGKVLTWVNLQSLIPSTDSSLKLWWQQARSSLTGKKQRILDSIIMLTAWSLWTERNNRVFEKNFKPVNILFDQIRNEARQWVLASKGRFSLSDG